MRREKRRREAGIRLERKTSSVKRLRTDQEHVISTGRSVSTPITGKQRRGRSRHVPIATERDKETVGVNETTKDEEEIGAGRSYFEAHKGLVRTSNLTLASLSIAPQDELQVALRNLKNPLQQEQEARLDDLRRRFDQYAYILSAGHSLLFYGFGSKKELLDEFAQYLTKSHAVIVVNAFNPTLSLRSVLAQIAKDFLNLDDFSKRTLSDYVDAIRSGIKGRRVGIAIHNIDGPQLRSIENQNALSSLGAISGVSIAASIDHVNAPLLWDGSMYSKYEWAWIKADTFAPYQAETVYCSKPLLHGGGERRVEGAIALLKSLSERARCVFEVLAQRQLSNDETGTAKDSVLSRTTFNQLFEIAKEKFFASDPASLRIILTELHTHDLLQSKRGVDAAEQLWIPLRKSQLEAIIRDISSAVECS